MAHFAILNSNNRVTQVVVIDNDDLLDADGVEQESLGVARCTEIWGPGSYVQGSYNDSFRGHYPAIDDLWDEERDLFIDEFSPIPPSWSLDLSTGRYEPPGGFPPLDTSRDSPIWDESTLSWVY